MSQLPKIRRWFRFSLRTLLLAMLVLGADFGWFAKKLKEARDQRLVVEAIEELGGQVRYDYLLDVEEDPFKDSDESMTQLAKRRLGKWLGEDFFGNVQVVRFSNERANPDLTVSDLAILASLKGLQVLDLTSTQITDATLAQLETFNALRELSLSDTQVTNDSLKHLRDLKNLKSLDLSITEITDPGLTHLSKFKKLRSLDLSATQITDAGLKHLAQLPDLELSLNKTDITNQGVQSLLALPHLKRLALAYTQIDQQSLLQLKAHGELRELIVGNTFDSDIDIDQLKKLLPDIEIQQAIYY